MTAKQKALALVAGGLAEDVADAAGQLLDMGEISEGTAEKLMAQAARQATAAYAVEFGEKYGVAL